MKNPDPETYGYDPAKVPEVNCLICDKKIGGEDFLEIRILSRFGQMLFEHKRCAGKEDTTIHE